MKPLTRHTLHLTPLSPLHLGTGEDYEPTNYLIHENALYTFDPARAILNPEQERELHAAAQSGDLQHIQRYFRNNPKPYIAAATHASSVSKGIAAEYQKNYGEIVQRESKGKNVHNRFQIERTATNPHNHQPYIPGSALKGSLRTALLEQRSADYRGDKPTAKQATHYENELLGSFATDLLRLLKPADLGATVPIATHIQYATNHKKRIVKGRERGNGPTGRRETIQHGQYRAFHGDITLQHLDLSHKPHLKDAAKKLPATHSLDLAALARAANTYHLRRFAREATLLSERGLVDPAWLKSTQQLIDQLKPALDAGSHILLRLGKNGGAESKTIDGYAQIKIMAGKGQKPTFEAQTKTVWLAADDDKSTRSLLPFGWVLIEIDANADNPALQQWSRANGAHLKAATDLQQQLATAQAEQHERSAAAQAANAARAAQAAEQAAAEQAEAARLATLPPWEQKLHAWQEELPTIKNNGAGDNAAIQFIDKILAGIQDVLKNPAADATARRKLADDIAALPLKKRSLISDKRQKEALNPLLRQLRGEA